MTPSPRVRLVIAAALFAGWMAWLGYAAVSKSRGPVVSRAQAAAATHPVVAAVEAGPDGAPPATVKVVERLTEVGPTTGTEIGVANLPAATGFEGTGEYLLLLVKDRGSDAYLVAGRQPSPAYESHATRDRPVVYRYSDHVRLQAARLFGR